jgi:hypothetical protein
LSEPSEKLTRFAIVCAKLFLLLILGGAIVFGLIGPTRSECQAPDTTGQIQPMISLMNEGFGFYASLMERVADHHRDAGDLETSVQLLGRVIAIKSRVLKSSDTEFVGLEEKYNAQIKQLPDTQYKAILKFSQNKCPLN